MRVLFPTDETPAQRPVGLRPIYGIILDDNETGVRRWCPVMEAGDRYVLPRKDGTRVLVTVTRNMQLETQPLEIRNEEDLQREYPHN